MRYKTSILYVDNDITILASMKMILGLIDCNVIHTELPNQALQFFKENPGQFKYCDY